jgi:hypothetical protein
MQGARKLPALSKVKSPPAQPVRTKLMAEVDLLEKHQLLAILKECAALSPTVLNKANEMIEAYVVCTRRTFPDRCRRVLDLTPNT